MEMKEIKFSSAPARIFLVALMILMVVGAWLTARTGLGVAVGIGAPVKEVADLGKELAPGNAFVHLASASILEKSFMPDDLPKALKEYEKAVTLSPNDFRLWLELSRAYERYGEFEKAERAFKRTSDLAPNYAVVQWNFGNFLLRRGRTDEAFVFIRGAARSDRSLIETAAALSWTLFNGDVSKITSSFGDTPNLRAGLAVHLSLLQRFDEAVELWKSIPADSREELKVADETLVSRLMEAHQYNKAVEILRLRKEAALPQIGMVSNSGFEEEILVNDANIFEWKIGESSGIHVGLDDTESRTGKRSFLIVFDTDGRTFRDISQVVVVVPNRSYRLSVSQKSDFRTSASMRWVIQNPMTGEKIASTSVVPMTSDWADVTVDFTVPDGLEGVIVRLVRDGCSTQICPIYGKVWFDDVALFRL
jgi:hypothetical protein